MKKIDLRRADLNLLVVFQRLLAERHVGRAAKRIHVKHSPATHALGRLRTMFHDPFSCGIPRAFNLPLVRLPWPPPLPTSSSAQTHCLLLLVDSTRTSHTPSPSAVPTLLCSPC